MWFLRWFHRHGPIAEILSDKVKESLTHFAANYKVTEHNSKIPMILLFFAKYKIPWIVKWHYVIEDNILSWHFSVKWWNKFSEERITCFVDKEFPKKLKNKNEIPSSSKSSIDTILNGKSIKDLAEIVERAAQLCAKAASQENSPFSSEGSSSSKPKKTSPEKPFNWYEDSRDPYDAYDLGEVWNNINHNSKLLFTKHAWQLQRGEQTGYHSLTK
jgi:hypothetical protein